MSTNKDQYPKRKKHPILGYYLPFEDNYRKSDCIDVQLRNDATCNGRKIVGR
jgi:hypothetical protein